jgi:hypothetical protein
LSNDVYTILHHLVDKSGARDERHLQDLHDTILSQQLGFGSLEELRAEQQKQRIAVDPVAAAQAQAQAFELLATVRKQQALIETLLTQAAAYQEARAAEAQAAVTLAHAEAQGSAPAMPFPVGPPAGEPPPPLTPAAGHAPAMPLLATPAPPPANTTVPAAPVPAVAPAAPRPTIPLPPTSQP